MGDEQGNRHLWVTHHVISLALFFFFFFFFSDSEFLLVETDASIPFTKPNYTGFPNDHSQELHKNPPQEN